MVEKYLNLLEIIAGAKVTAPDLRKYKEAIEKSSLSNYWCLKSLLVRLILTFPFTIPIRILTILGISLLVGPLLLSLLSTAPV
jgi:hypothetical protein